MFDIYVKRVSLDERVTMQLESYKECLWNMTRSAKATPTLHGRLRNNMARKQR